MEADFAKNNDELRVKREDKTRLLQDFQQQLQQKRRKLAELNTQQGTQKAERQRYERNLQQRGQVVRDQAAHLEISGYDSTAISEPQVEQFRETLRDQASRLKTQATRIMVSDGVDVKVKSSDRFRRMLEKRAMKLSRRSSTSSRARN